MVYYGTPEGFREYCVARDISLPVAALDDDDVMSGLLVASEWIDGGYQPLFPGVKTAGRSQEREWPRIGAIDRDGHYLDSLDVPREMERATYQATAIHMNTPGALLVDYTPSKYKSVSVDGAISVQFSDFEDALSSQTQFLTISRILAPLLTNSGIGTRLTGLAYRG